MTDIPAMPSDSLVKARTSADMQVAFVRQALKYLQERLSAVCSTFCKHCLHFFHIVRFL